MPYLIKFIYNKQGYHSEQYYCGKRYRYGGEKYATISGNIDNAKLFKSKRTALNAFYNLRENCVNVPYELEGEERSEIIEDRTDYNSK